MTREEAYERMKAYIPGYWQGDKGCRPAISYCYEIILARS